MLAAFVFAGLASGYWHQESAPKEADPKSLIALQLGLSRIGRGIIIDLGPKQAAVPLNVKEANEEGLRSLAKSMGRIFEETENTILIRIPRLDEAQNSAELSLDIITRMPPEVLNQALDTGLRFSDVPSQYRDDLIAAAAISPDAAQNITAHSDTTYFRLSVGAMAQITSANGDHNVPIYTAGCYIPSKLRNEPAKAADKPASLRKPVPIDGPLKFGSGEILPLNEIMDRASKALGQSYVVDRRLRGEVVFISGSYTRAEFERSFDKLTRVSPMQNSRRKPSDMFKHMYEAVLATFHPTMEAPKGPDFQQLMSGKPMDVNAFNLLDGPDGVMTQLSTQFKLGPDASITLMPILNITVDDGLGGPLHTLLLKGY